MQEKKTMLRARNIKNLPEPDTLIDEIIENIESSLMSFRTIKDIIE